MSGQRDTATQRDELRAFGPTVEYQERGELFALTGVRGVDPGTGELAPTPQAQFSQAFAHVRQISGLVGFGLTEIGRVTVATPDAAFRPHINPPWLQLFPDEADRPARKTTHAPAPPDVHVELQVVGVRGATRQAVEIEGVRHRDPLPMGARLGRHVFSSVIPPDLPGGGRPEGVDAIKQTFRNMADFIRAAGGSLDDIANAWVYLGMWDLHPEMVDEWVATFPDARSRPTRKTFYYPRVTMQTQCEAVLGGTRANAEIPGLGHHDPIPMGACTGGLFTSSGLDGRDPDTGQLPRGVAAQSEQAIENLRLLLAQANSPADGLLHVTGLVGEGRYAAGLQDAWRRAFPDRANAAAFEIMELGLPARDMLVQLIARGVGGTAETPR